MKVPYIFRKNPLTERPDDYVGKVVVFESVDQKRIVQQIVAENGTISEADAMNCVQAYEKQIKKEVMAGHNVVTPMCNISLSISGVFDREVTEFDPELHKINLNFKPGVDFRKVPEMIELVKIEAPEILPEIEFFEDSESETKNDKLTPGVAAKIQGARIKTNPEDAEEGIFFVSEDGDSFKVTSFLRNMPSEAIFNTPKELTAGKYKLQVRTKMDGKTLRIGELDFELTVE